MKLNFNFYKEDVLYNNLDNEDLIIDDYIGCCNKEENNFIMNEAITIDKMMIFSDIRSNIINWYPFKKDATVLEIGANLGQITGELCKNTKKVVSVEFSKKRGEAIAKRHKKIENLEIIIGNLQDIEFKEKFDYIILVGVFEYAPKIYKSDNPFFDLLVFLKTLLKKNGKLLIATDNKFSMRNWSATKIEEGDLGYNAVCSSKLQNSSQLLSKKAIENLICSAGFEQYKFYYPLPDYKFTNVIFTDKFLPEESNLHRNLSVFYEDEILSFNENDGYLQLINEDKELFKMYANSFFLEINKDNKEDNNIKYVSFWNNRHKEYMLKTIIQGDRVYKYPLNEEARPHINQMKKIIDILNKSKINTVDYYEDERIVSKYQRNFNSYDKIIIEAYKKDGIDGVINSILVFKEKILDKIEKTTSENNVLRKYNIECNKNLIDEMTFLKYGIWDLNFQNCLVIDDELYMFDQEWIEEDIPIEFIIYRSILTFYELNRIIDREELYDRLNFKKYINIFEKLESKISSKIISKDQISIFNRPVKNVRGLYIQNEQYKKQIDKLEQEIVDKNETINIKKMEILRKNEELEELRIKKFNLEKSLNDIYNSKSWAITKLLKKIIKH